LFFTKVGELTLLVEDFRILCKALLSLPSIKYGIHDTEIRYRKRYLDLLINERTRETFILRSKIINEIRSFLNSKGFIEIETPILQPIYGGANAKPFKTHVNFLNEDWYLRISPELYLKRLVIGGINKVYEIGKVFRNEDIDVEHNPEFTMIEIYQSYVDYNDVMKLTEELISTVALKVLGKLEIEYGEYKINLALPWKRITMYDAIKMFSGFDVKKISDNEIIDILEQYKIKIPGGYNRGLAIAKLFDIYCKDNLIQPTFIIDHPKETTPLCKLHRENKELIERFELYIAKMELANAYTELNDPVLQHQFFLEEMNRRTLGDEEAHQYDEDFIEAMCYGMPPIGGLGIGIDRLVMIFTGNTSIKEVIPFPMMKKSMSSFNFKDFLNCKK
jgi:lysyl-tRNA synthetase class 2